MSSAPEPGNDIGEFNGTDSGQRATENKRLLEGGLWRRVLYIRSCGDGKRISEKKKKTEIMTATFSGICCRLVWCHACSETFESMLVSKSDITDQTLH